MAVTNEAKIARLELELGKLRAQVPGLEAAAAESARLVRDGELAVALGEAKDADRVHAAHSELVERLEDLRSRIAMLEGAHEDLAAQRAAQAGEDLAARVKAAWAESRRRLDEDRQAVREWFAMAVAAEVARGVRVGNVAEAALQQLEPGRHPPEIAARVSAEAGGLIARLNRGEVAP